MRGGSWGHSVGASSPAVPRIASPSHSARRQGSQWLRTAGSESMRCWKPSPKKLKYTRNIQGLYINYKAIKKSY